MCYSSKIGLWLINSTFNHKIGSYLNHLFISLLNLINANDNLVWTISDELCYLIRTNHKKKLIHIYLKLYALIDSLY